MIEKLTLHTLYITRKAELQHFQLVLPADAAEIIGIETGIANVRPTGAWINNEATRFQFVRNELFGELRLQLCNKANWFYAAEIVEQDNHLNYADYTNNNFWQAKDWTHRFRRFAEEVQVKTESHLLSGMYREKWMEQHQQQLSYEVKIYVWYKTKEEHDD